MTESIRKAAAEIRDQVAIMIDTLPEATRQDAICRFSAIEQYARAMVEALETFELDAPPPVIRAG